MEGGKNIDTGFAVAAEVGEPEGGVWGGEVSGGDGGEEEGGK